MWSRLWVWRLHYANSNCHSIIMGGKEAKTAKSACLLSLIYSLLSSFLKILFSLIGLKWSAISLIKIVIDNIYVTPKLTRWNCCESFTQNISFSPHSSPVGRLLSLLTSPFKGNTNRENEYPAQRHSCKLQKQELNLSGSKALHLPTTFCYILLESWG